MNRESASTEPKAGAAQLSAYEIETIALFDSCMGGPVEFARRLRAEWERDGEFQRVPNALLEQTNARIDELERQLDIAASNALVWESRCNEFERQLATIKKERDGWEGDHSHVAEQLQLAERQLATVAQAERDRIIAICRTIRLDGRRTHDYTTACAQIESAILATAPRAGEPEAEHPDFARSLALATGGVCATCGFTYLEHNGHIIACPVCECARLRAVAAAAKALIEASPPFATEAYDALVAAVRDLERGWT